MEPSSQVQLGDEQVHQAREELGLQNPACPSPQSIIAPRRRSANGTPSSGARWRSRRLAY